MAARKLRTAVEASQPSLFDALPQDETWKTAQEWAVEGLPGIAGTERGIQLRAGKDEWPFRLRAGRGGGREYPLSALPAEARKAFERRQIVEATKAARATEQRQIETIPATALTARQRTVMEARAAILHEVDRLIAQGSPVKAAVRHVAQLARAGELPGDLQALSAVANDRGDKTGALGERIIMYWRAAKAERGVAALAPQLTREPAPLPIWFRDFLRFYATPQNRTVAHALDLWARSAPGADLPTYRQVRVALGKLSAIEKARGRMGSQAIRQLHAYKSRDTSDLLPTSVYVADGKTFVAEVANPLSGRPFRPELTTIIDAHTRRITGWSAGLDESATGVVDALRRACMDAGIPAIFYTDRGPGYRNKAMDDPLTGFLARLDITTMRAIAYNSQAKAVVERFNAQYTRLSREAGTYLGRDMDREAKIKVHKAVRRDLALKGASDLLPSWEAFLAAVGDMIARYNAEPHPALAKIRDDDTGKWRHMSPDEAWRAACDGGFEPIPVTAEEADDLFRPWVIRRTARCMIEFATNSYFAEELEAYHGKDVIVAYDLRDARQIWVRHIDLVDGERQPGRLIAIARFEGNKTRYVPVSMETLAMERRAEGRARRLGKHLDAVRAELRPTMLLEASSRAPIAVPMAADLGPISLAPAEAPKAVRLRPDGRPIFRSDVEFGAWITANPAAATAGDREYIAELLGSTTAKEMLRISGVDLEALRSIARSAA